MNNIEFWNRHLDMFRNSNFFMDCSTAHKILMLEQELPRLRFKQIKYCTDERQEDNSTKLLSELESHGWHLFLEVSEDPICCQYGIFWRELIN